MWRGNWGRRPTLVKSKTLFGVLIVIICTQISASRDVHVLYTRVELRVSYVYCLPQRSNIGPLSISYLSVMANDDSTGCKCLSSNSSALGRVDAGCLITSAREGDENNKELVGD